MCEDRVLAAVACSGCPLPDEFPQSLSGWRRALRRPRASAATTWRLLAGVVALAAVAYAATTVMDIPPPYRLYQLEVAEPSRRGELFPAREVAAPAVPWALPAQPEPPPATVPWRAARSPSTASWN